MAQTYEVQQGDSLNKIAKDYGYSDYKSAGITGFGNNPDLINPGQKLTITGKPLTSNPVVSSQTPRKEFNVNSANLTNMLQKYAPQQAQQQQNNQQTKGGTSTPLDNSKPSANKDNATISNYSDPYTQALDKMKANSDLATQNLIATIQAKRQNRENEVNREYERYKGGLQLLGIQTENIKSTPDIISGNIQQAENARLSKLQDLDQQEATALLEAQMARDEKDFTLLKDRMDYIKEIKKERLNTLKDSYDMLKTEQGIADIQAEQIYTQLKTLNPEEKNIFIQQVAQRFGIPPTAIVAGVAKLAEAEKKKATGGSGATSTTASKNKLISNIQKIFNNKKQINGYSVLGSDGYIDPQAYVQAYEQWINSNLPVSEFKSKFPAKSYINPESYLLLPLPVRPTSSSATEGP